MTSILVCGSLAFDDIGFFDQRLSADTRNVKLTRLYRAFGGCAMNIAYNLKRLGDEPLPFAYVGDDYVPEYQAHLLRLEISQKGIRKVPDTLSSRGIVLPARTRRGGWRTSVKNSPRSSRWVRKAWPISSVATR